MENFDRTEEVQIDLTEIFRELKKNIWIILLAGVIGACCFFIYSTAFVTPMYRSTTKVYVLPRSGNSEITNQDLTAGTQLTADYSEMVKSRPVLEKVIAEQHLDETTDELAKQITVSTSSDTRIITIHVLDEDPKLAKDIANSLSTAVKSQITSVMSVSVNTVEDANLPTEPYTPNITKNTVIGFGVGILLAIAIVLIIYFLDDTIKTPDDVEKYLGLSTLGSIPFAKDSDSAPKKRWFHRKKK